MSTAKYIYLSSRDELLRINIAKVVYMEADGNYTKIFLPNNLSGTVCISLSKMEKLIADKVTADKAKFARIGKRYIVNLAYIFRINVLRQELVLSDQSSFNVTLAISHDALKNLKDAILNRKTNEKDNNI